MKKIFFTVLMLMFILLKSKANGCEQTISILLKSYFGENPLITNGQRYITSSGDTIQIDRLRYYVSGFELMYENGMIHKIKDFYHLVDQEEESSQTVTFTKIPVGKITLIKFNIGVDSSKSVSGAHGGDLDPAKGMYWAWNSGYINAKLEGRSNSCPTHLHAFEFHIGGYSRPHNSLRTVILKVPTENSTKQIILKADVACWFTDIDLSKTNGIMPPGKEAMQMATKYEKMFSVITK